MRFLVKRDDSPLIGARYAAGGHNERILAGLLHEQHGFCAYSEKWVSQLETTAIEHFDRELKNTDADGYHNYYAVLQSVNQRKRRREAAHEGATFFRSRFFQSPNARVRYVPGEGVFEEVEPEDHESRDLIAYLGFNENDLFEERRKSVARLRDLFDLAELDRDGRLTWFRDHPEDRSFPTALEAELDLPPLVP